jgi:hypothetical protein
MSLFYFSMHGLELSVDVNQSHLHSEMAQGSFAVGGERAHFARETAPICPRPSVKLSFFLLLEPASSFFA